MKWVVAPSSKPTLDTIAKSIKRLLRKSAAHAERGPTLEEVAADLLSSRSQVQRALADAGTTFSDVLFRLRVQLATDLLIRQRRSAREAAQAVGVAPDHLRTLLLRGLGVSPGEIKRVLAKVDKASRWRRTAPPPYGTVLYRKRRRDWTILQRDVERLVSDIPVESPIYGWSREVLRQTRRPDFRRSPHRDLIRATRHEEQMQIIALLEAALRDALGSEQSGEAVA